MIISWNLFAISNLKIFHKGKRFIFYLWRNDILKNYLKKKNFKKFCFNWLEISLSFYALPDGVTSIVIIPSLK